MKQRPLQLSSKDRGVSRLTLIRACLINGDERSVRGPIERGRMPRSRSLVKAFDLIPVVEQVLPDRQKTEVSRETSVILQVMIVGNLAYLVDSQGPLWHRVGMGERVYLLCKQLESLSFLLKMECKVVQPVYYICACKTYHVIRTPRGRRVYRILVKESCICCTGCLAYPCRNTRRPHIIICKYC